MTATEELRRMLDERGVRWKRVRGHKDNGTSWHDRYGSYVEAVQEYAWDGGEFPEGKMIVRRGPTYLTPGQAIAATLGHEDTYTREDVESAFVSGYSLGSLPVGSDPRWDENRQTVDEHMAELGWVRKDTLGAGTCHNASKVMDEHGQARFACSECGAWIDSRMLWNPEYRNGESPWVSDCKLNYCPNCGRKVVDE